MKNKVKELIISLGCGVTELLIDFELGEYTFNSIEYHEETDKVILHIFEDDQDYYFDFEDLDSYNQKYILELLQGI